MQEIALEEIKQLQIGILKAFADYCESNKLTYYLGYGTLIGTMRHKGYIPWDDDIDVIMPRPDYLRFINGFKDGRYKVFCPEHNPECPIPYAKLYDDTTLIHEHTTRKYQIGLNIDIFVLDGMPNNEAKAKRHIKNCSFWINILEVKKIAVSSKRSFVKNAELLLLKALTLPFSYTKARNRLVKLSQKYNYTESSFCSDLSYTAALHLPKSVFFRAINSSFEGREYAIPQGYDTWLRGIYGDYMQLPPEDKRITHHDYIAYKLY